MSEDKSEEKTEPTEEKPQTTPDDFPTEESEVHEIVLKPEEIPRTQR